MTKQELKDYRYTKEEIKPKDFLNRYCYLDASINSKLAQVQRMRELAAGVAPPGDGKSSGKSDRVGSIVSKIVDLEAEIYADIDALVNIGREIRAVISKVADDRYRTILTERYINGKTFEEIAVKCNYSWRHTVRLHGKALLAFKNAIE